MAWCWHGRSVSNGGGFFLSLAAFSIVHRGNREHGNAVGLARRHITVLNTFWLYFAHFLAARMAREDGTCKRLMTAAQDESMDNFGLPLDQLLSAANVDLTFFQQLIQWETKVPHW